MGGAYALAAEQHRIVALRARPLGDLEGGDVVHDVPVRAESAAAVKASMGKLFARARAHLTVCFVSGYLGFSFGRLTRGAHLSSLERKMEGWRSFTRSGTLMPPLMIIGDRPALANPSIAAAARGAGGRRGGGRWRTRDADPRVDC
mgnify:CR=1 FL=1